MTMKTNDVHERLKSICLFLSDYSTNMLSAGATTSRIERCVGRMAREYDVEVDISILPTRVLVNVWNKQREHSYNQVGRAHTGGINLNTIAKLTQLSHRIEEQKTTQEDGEVYSCMAIKEANKQMSDIIDEPRINHYEVMVLTSLANMSFCKLFGGDWTAMGIVFVATAVGFYYKSLMLRWHMDARIVTTIAGLISAILGTSGFIFGISDTPETAVATSVLWLVPGIRFINAISDMLAGHHLVAQSRLAEAIITTISLSIGLCLALLITNIEWR